MAAITTMTDVTDMVDIKEARINLRARPQDKDIIERAAQLRGQNLSHFILSEAVKQAKEVLEAAGVMVLDEGDRQAFVNAFLNPPEPTPYMQRAIKSTQKG